MVVPKRKRLYEIDQLTGFAIILVVIGHLVASDYPKDNHWYEALRYGIYKFHMPLFMFISGIVFFHSIYSRYDIQSYREWSMEKISRLAPGFFLLGIIVILGKDIASCFFYVDNPPPDLFGSIGKLFLSPINSPNGSLWYIYVLLELYLVFPLLMPFMDKFFLLIFIVTFCLHCLSTQHLVSQWLMARSFCEYALFFYFGILAKRYYFLFCHYAERLRFVSAGLFILSFLSVLLVPEKISKSIIGFFSLPACFYWMGLLRTSWSDFFIWVGSYSLTIYLFNTIFIGATKALLLKLVPWNGEWFLLFFVVMFFSGLYGPIFCHKWILSKIPYVHKITR